RDENGANHDFGLIQDLKLKPGETYSYNQSRSLPKEGEYTFFIARHDGTSWQTPPFGNLGNDTNTVLTKHVMNAPSVIEGLGGLYDTKFHKNQPIEATFKMRNNS